MVTVNITVTDDAVQPEIYLGRQGEKQAREIVFDLSALREKYGTGTATLCHQRSRDTAPYVVGESTGDTLTWVISDTDTAFPGIGFCEFRYTFGSDSLSKSTMFATNVKESLNDDIVAPEPLQSYFDKMMDYIKSRGNAGAGMTSDVISALLDCFAHVAWIDEDGQDYYDALENALHDIYWNVSNILTHCVSSNPATSITKGTQYLATITPSVGYTLTGATVAVKMGGTNITSEVYSNGVINIPTVTGDLIISVTAEAIPVTLESIEAVYTQTGTVYNDATLDSLKSDLVVTATYSDTSSATIPSTDYTLSGTLAVGTSTITVTCSGKTDTFTVTVTAAPTLSSISAVYTQSGTVYDTDTLDSLKTDLVVTAYYSDSSTQTVTNYTLSGTLAEGTSTVTVSYGGKTTTFNATVSHTDVPSGYTQYDYITYDYEFGKSNVNNAIKTDIAMTSEYSFDISFSYKNDGGGAQNQTECVCGSRSAASGTKQFALFVNRTTTKLGYWYGGTDTTKTINLAQDVVNHVIVQPVGVSEDYPNNATINLNGTDYDTGSTTTGATWASWFSFFGYGTSATGTATDNAYELKIGRTMIKDLNDNTLYDFIPAYNGTNYGLYERINNNFYTGADPSHFICGNWSQGA